MFLCAWIISPRSIDDAKWFVYIKQRCSVCAVAVSYLTDLQSGNLSVSH